MINWYIKYCALAFIVGIIVGYLIGDYFTLYEYILVPGHIVPSDPQVST